MTIDSHMVGHLMVATLVGLMGWIGTLVVMGYRDLKSRVARIEDHLMLKPTRGRR